MREWLANWSVLHVSDCQEWGLKKWDPFVGVVLVCFTQECGIVEAKGVTECDASRFPLTELEFALYLARKVLAVRYQADQCF